MPREEREQEKEMPPMGELLNSWLGLTAAARAAGVAERTMAYMVAQGKMRSIQTPIGRLIEPTQLIPYAKAHRERFRMDGYLTSRERSKAHEIRKIEEEEAHRPIT